MNDETIGLLGQFSHELLKDDRFIALCEMFKQQMAVDIIETLPHEQKKREGIHAAFTGFSEFSALLHKFAEAYLRMYEPPPAQDENYED